MTLAKLKKISIVTPVHNEQESIRPFYDSCKKVLASKPYKFEIIFVDDGSVDKSVLKIESLKPTKNIKPALLQLSRNFGKEIALTAGLQHCRGDAAVLIDSDLQHPIESIPEFIDKWERGADVVVGVRQNISKESGFKTLASRLFHGTLERLSETKVVPGSTDFRLLDRQVINAFNSFTERRRTTRGLVDWLGFKREVVTYKEKPRQFGAPSYSYRKLVGLAVNSTLSYSIFPLKIAGYLGVVMLILSGLLGSFVVVEQLIMSDPMGLNFTGAAMLGIVILFMCGVIMTSLGLVSAYIAVIHSEAMGRPLYVVKERRKG